MAVLAEAFKFFRYSVASLNVVMLTRRSIDGLGLQREFTLDILHIDKGRCGGDAVRNLCSSRFFCSGFVLIFDCSRCTRLDAENVNTGTCHPATELESGSQIAFRSAAIFDVICRLSVRTCGCILHLPYCRSGESEMPAQISIHCQLRSAAERAERSTGFECEDRTKVCCKRMPSLTHLKIDRSRFPPCHRKVLPTESEKSLTKTHGGRSCHTGESRIEISLNLSPN